MDRSAVDGQLGADGFVRCKKGHKVMEVRAGADGEELQPWCSSCHSPVAVKGYANRVLLTKLVDMECEAQQFRRQLFQAIAALET